MNPRTRRLRRIRRKQRKREAVVADMLRRGYPRLKIAAEMAARAWPFTLNMEAAFDV